MVFHLLKCCSTVILSPKNVFKKLDCRYIFTTTKMGIPPSSINPAELHKYDSKSDEWWQGQTYDLLRLYNSVRLPLIRDGLLTLAKCNQKTTKPLAGYIILDVGCGGGILSEPLARLGAKVTGLDPGPNNIKSAIDHANKDPEVKENLTYVCDTVENLTTLDSRFDAVVVSEVIEHVNNVSAFVQSCVDLARNSGSIFFTTVNRTNFSYFASILMAEYVLNIVPQGTHDWNNFVKPKDLIELLESLNCRIVSLEGIMYNPITKKFSFCKSIENQYALHAVKL